MIAPPFSPARAVPRPWYSTALTLHVSSAIFAVRKKMRASAAGHAEDGDSRPWDSVLSVLLKHFKKHGRPSPCISRQATASNYETSQNAWKNSARENRESWSPRNFWSPTCLTALRESLSLQ